MTASHGADAARVRLRPAVGPARRGAGRAVVVGGAVAVAVATMLLAGCTTAAPQPRTGSSVASTELSMPPTSTVPPALTADDVRARGTTLPAGEATLTALSSAGEVRTETLDDGSVRFTVDVADGTSAPTLALTLAAPPGSTFDAQVDGSVVLRAADGGFAGGLAVPSTSTTTGLLKGRYAPVSGDVLTLTVSTLRTESVTGGTVTGWFGTRMLESADWGEREGGRSLAVRPTTWARGGGLAAQEGAWGALVAAEPEVDTTGMHDQFLCHALGAPDKESWNLEPWRPDVGSIATLAARCNPT